MLSYGAQLVDFGHIYGLGRRQEAFDEVAFLFNFMWCWLEIVTLDDSLCVQNLEDNVRTGSAVFEEDHFLVLGWCNNQRDEEVIWKILSQV